MTQSQHQHLQERGLTSMVILFPPGLRSMYAASTFKALRLATFEPLAPPPQNISKNFYRTTHGAPRYRTARCLPYFSRCGSGSRTRHWRRVINCLHAGSRCVPNGILTPGITSCAHTRWPPPQNISNNFYRTTHGAPRYRTARCLPYFSRCGSGSRTRHWRRVINCLHAGSRCVPNGILTPGLTSCAHTRWRSSSQAMPRLSRRPD